mmetsp:Transcript_39964/g.93799  ORF Transcript_39964/g.93799 Transcript_39964/m.93799 type:complete len:546 (-) Transcript_39964:314-1951(-)|eukprot:CAMPEP_0113301354 /NCGR_PEP_ID=MMETSP0010_2-20120614/2618_1 /TAXON_ID=216773 ORGANISM="Corethron hystrix, Strain 308" /NCGR_SAMPLE_ID=MMETSP0010_2 /ASSEMBLY_ACC=CAM_ASM_000155 /LENGTH=545 /DNA_ID=CAMNT_0000154963 /DNA_START=1618 /DNA_END=3255 /DNA_ORIENTATION=- /assembly_acc=CAM_ASM_000155
MDTYSQVYDHNSRIGRSASFVESEYIVTDDGSRDIPGVPVLLSCNGSISTDGALFETVPSPSSYSSSCASRDSSGRSIGEIVDLFLSRVEDSDHDDNDDVNDEGSTGLSSEGSRCSPSVSPLTLTVALRKVRSTPFSRDCVGGGTAPQDIHAPLGQPATPHPGTIPRAPPGTPMTPTPSDCPDPSLFNLGNGVCPASPSPVIPFPGSPGSPFRTNSKDQHRHCAINPSSLPTIRDDDDPLWYGRATCQFATHAALSPKSELSADENRLRPRPKPPIRSASVMHIDVLNKRPPPPMIWETGDDAGCIQDVSTPLNTSHKMIIPKSDGQIPSRRHSCLELSAIVTPGDDVQSFTEAVPYIPTRGSARELSFTDVGRVVDSDTSDIFVTGSGSTPPSPILSSELEPNELLSNIRMCGRPISARDRIPSIRRANVVDDSDASFRKSPSFILDVISDDEREDGADENCPPHVEKPIHSSKVTSEDWLNTLRATPDDLAEAASSKFLRGGGSVVMDTHVNHGALVNITMQGLTLGPSSDDEQSLELGLTLS